MVGLGNIGPGLCYSAGTVLPVVCIVLVVLRFYSRKTSKVQIGWDDWLVIPALIALIGMAAAILTGVALHGVAYPEPKVDTSYSHAPSKQQTMTRLILWIVYLLGPISLTLVKISFVLWYRRLFWRGSSKWYRATLCSVGLILIVWGTSFFFAFLFICPGHPSAYWGTTAEVLKKCNKTTTLYQAYSTSDTILDVIVFILPMLPLWGLQMSRKRRVGVLGVFMLGALTIVASILRMTLIWEATLAEYKPGTDIPLLLTSGMYWGLVEGGVALISCCLPPCSVLIKRKKNNDDSKQRQSRTSMRQDSQRSHSGMLNPTPYHQTAASFDGDNSASYATPDGILVTKTYSARPMEIPWEKLSASESGSST